jgi:hypothetical protein
LRRGLARQQFQLVRLSRVRRRTVIAGCACYLIELLNLLVAQPERGERQI